MTALEDRSDWTEEQIHRTVRAMAALERMVSKVRYDTTTGCIIWTGCLNSKGYGVVSVAGRRELAHRISYEAEIGRIPDELTVDHLCRNKPCLNPAHMELVTRAENSRRGSLGTAATHCKRGHELAGDNVIVKKRGAGRTPCRNCRACHNEQRAARTTTGLLAALTEAAS